MFTCPEGHDSDAGDYCDTCGAPISAGQGTAAGMAVGAGSGAGEVPRAPGTGGDAQAVVGSSAVASSLDLEPANSTVQCPHCDEVNLVDALFCEACGYDFTTGALPLGAEAEVDREPESAPEPVPEPEQESESEPEPQPEPEQESEPEPQPVVEVAAPRTTPEVAADPVPPADPVPQVAPERTPAAHVRPRHTPPSRDLDDTWVVEVWIDPDWYAVQQTQQACPSAGVPDIVRVRRNVVLVGRPSGSRGGRPEVDAGSDSAVSRRHAQLTSDGRRWWIEDLGSSNGTFVGVVGDPLPTKALAPGTKIEIDRDDRIYIGAWTRLVLRQATESERRGEG